MSNRPKGRHPRHVRAIADRYPYNHGGAMVVVTTVEGKRREDWFPGTVRDAVVAARIAYPGCAVRHVEEFEWHDWVTIMQDWADYEP